MFTPLQGPPPSSRNTRAPRSRWPHLALVTACALTPLVACRSSSRLPKTTPVTTQMRTDAAAATQREQWDQAAQLWWSIYCGSDKRDVAACAETARAMMHMNDAESALKVIEQGLSVAPHSAELHELKGDALVQQNFRRAAEACYAESARLDPKRKSAWRALGRTRVELGYEAAAVEPLKKAIELGDEVYPTWSLLARAYDASGDACAAFDAYTHAFRIGPGEPAQLLRASTLYLNDAVRRANDQAAPCCEDWLERAIELRANLTPPQTFPEGHFELGVLEERQGDKDAAIAHYRRALVDDRNFLPALRNLALLYAQRGDETNAIEMAQRALELEKDNDRRKALLRLLEPLTRPGTDTSKPAPVPPPVSTPQKSSAESASPAKPSAQAAQTSANAATNGAANSATNGATNGATATDAAAPIVKPNGA